MDLQNKVILYLHKEKLKGLTEIKAFGWKAENVFHAPYSLASGGESIHCYLILPDTEFSYRDVDLADPFIAVYSGGGVDKAYFCDKHGVVNCELRYMPQKSELYSRSRGLLEVDKLEKKHVLIIGLGSFGSFIAVELAKAGAGNFTLIDFDRVEPANISRHTCGINDLGRYKTLAVRDAMMAKNPFVNVYTIEQDINGKEKLLEECMSRADITICVTDNNRSRFNVNSMALKLHSVVFFGRAITRAEGGDVFRLEGNRGPCYCCLIGNDGKMKFSGEDEISSSRQANSLPSYVSEQDRNAVIQAGLSSDILPICNLIVKLALTELSANSNNELSYPFYIWANRREKQYVNWAPFDKQDNRPTILRWYGVKVPKNEDCPICSSTSIHE